MTALKVKNVYELPENYTGAVKFSDGTKIWLKDGKYHRSNGPAEITETGTKVWCQHGLYHRTDGPAIEFATGQKKYYVDGLELTKKQFEIFRFMWENTVKEKTQELMKIYVNLALVKDKQI